MKYIDTNFFIPVLEKGEKIYHYTSASGLQGICKGEFWVTEQHFLNDMLEYQIATNVFLELMRKHISNNEVFEEIKKQMLEEMYSWDRMGELGELAAYSGDYIISFCLDEDSPLLWAEYSDFMGYCMRFDFQGLLDSFIDKVNFHGQVIYNHEEQLDCMFRTFDAFFRDNKDYGYPTWDSLNELDNKGISSFVNWASVVCIVYNMFYKDPCFEGEHEYRFIFSCGHDGGRFEENEMVPQYFRIKDEGLIPYIKRKIRDLHSLEAVVVGPKNKSDIAVKGLEYFFRNMKLDVGITKSKMPLRY